MYLREKSRQRLRYENEKLVSSRINRCSYVLTSLGRTRLSSIYEKINDTNTVNTDHELNIRRKISKKNSEKTKRNGNT